MTFDVSYGHITRDFDFLVKIIGLKYEEYCLIETEQYHQKRKKLEILFNSEFLTIFSESLFSLRYNVHIHEAHDKEAGWGAHFE